MRILLLLCCFLALARGARADIDHAAISTFNVALQRACDRKDIEGIKALYDFDGVSDTGIDYEIGQWEDLFNYIADHHLTVTEVSFVDKDAYLARANIDQAAVERQSGLRKRNGTWYRPTLDVIGFELVSSQNSSNSTAITFRVGLGKDGALRLVADVRGSSTP